MLIEFPKADPIVHLEHHRSSLFLYDQKDVKDYRAATDTVCGVAMTAKESVEFIAEMIDTKETAA